MNPINALLSFHSTERSFPVLYIFNALFIEAQDMLME